MYIIVKYYCGGGLKFGLYPGGGGIPPGGGGIPPGGGGIPPGGGGIPPGGGIPGGGGRAPGGGALACGIILPGAGAPTPGAGPASPAGAIPGAIIGIPLPAALPIPGPGTTPAAFTIRASSAGGGPSTTISITSSPLSIINPRTLLFSLSSSGTPFFGGSCLYSSASPNTKFICLSKAINLPTICRPS